MAYARVTRSQSGRIFGCAIALLAVTALLLVAKNDTSGAQPAKGSGSASVSAKGSDSKSPSTSSSGSSSSAKETKVVELKRVGMDYFTPTSEMVKLIDDKLDEAWKANNVQPAEICSDHEYCRRAYLDIIGRIPKPEEITEFLNHNEGTGLETGDTTHPMSRRVWLIEKLLRTDDYPDNWANIWTNWLLTRSGTFGRGKYHMEMHKWVADQFALNVHHDKFVKELVAAKGKSKEDGENGNVLFILAHVGEMTGQGKAQEEGQFDMVPITARMTRLFLGIQTQCTQCHDHPFDKRLQEEFWGVNAFLRQAIRIGNPGARRGQQLEDLELRDSGNNKSGTVFYEKRNGVIKETAAVFLDGKKPNPGAGRRDELAKFIVEHDSFPKAYVNRMWAHFFGRGFVNPIDDFNSKNDVNHPELFNELSVQFKHYNFDTKQLIRWICNSKAYNLKAVANATNDKPEQDVLFSRMTLKAFSPEELFESLMTATQGDAPKTDDAKKKKRDLKEQWMNRLVSNFGDDEGNEVVFSGTVVQALLMMNGDDINNAITDGNGTVAHVLKKNGTNAVKANITDLYLLTLNRKPTEKEIELITKGLPLFQGKKDAKPEAPWHDLMWALLNTNEFLLNH